MPAPRRDHQKKPRIWRIDRYGPSADYVGIVVALNAEAAIEQACKKFGITDSEHREQLVARELS
jgi:hypothetical protein